MKRRFYVVVYDVVDDRRRSKISRFLESLGERVQKSVFEIYLTEKELERLRKKINRWIEAQEDSVRLYELCAMCREKAESIGQGQLTPPPGLTIV
jgi:CRISPR-associated protein Cas2